MAGSTSAANSPTAAAAATTNPTTHQLDAEGKGEILVGGESLGVSAEKPKGCGSLNPFKFIETVQSNISSKGERSCGKGLLANVAAIGVSFLSTILSPISIVAHAVALVFNLTIGLVVNLSCGNTRKAGQDLLSNIRAISRGIVQTIPVIGLHLTHGLDKLGSLIGRCCCKKNDSAEAAEAEAAAAAAAATETDEAAAAGATATETLVVKSGDDSETF